MRCPTDVNTIPGFSLDSCDILANFVSIVSPASAYRLCFLFDMTLHGRPARTGLSRLPQHFLRVLFGHPTSAGLLRFFLLRLFRIPDVRNSSGARQTSPVDLKSLTARPASKLRGSGGNLALIDYLRIAFGV